jgi:hypothetical protein
MDLSRVIIFTDDVIRLADFYASCFELDGVGESSPDWTELRAGSCNIAFHKISEHGQNRDGWIKIVFGSRDVAADKSRLEDLGVKMSDIVRFGEIQLSDGQDPDGNWFQISSRGM